MRDLQPNSFVAQKPSLLLICFQKSQLHLLMYHLQTGIIFAINDGAKVNKLDGRVGGKPYATCAFFRPPYNLFGEYLQQLSRCPSSSNVLHVNSNGNQLYRPMGNSRILGLLDKNIINYNRGSILLVSFCLDVFKSQISNLKYKISNSQKGCWFLRHYFFFFLFYFKIHYISHPIKKTN